MQIGVVFPQTEVGAAVADVRRTRSGSRPRVHPPVGVRPRPRRRSRGARAWRGPYDVTTTFHEPFVLFGYLAACTRLELVTGVIILPQRQTALVAKQAAEVDLLTEGRFRLGVGIGWNPVEYEALGQSFGERGRRMSEQIPLLRRLLSEPVVSHVGIYDRMTGAGLARCPRSGRSRSGSAANRLRPIADRPPRGRLVPPGAAGAEARRGQGDDRRGGERGRARPCRAGDRRPGAVVKAGIGAFLEAVGRWRESARRT